MMVNFRTSVEFARALDQRADEAGLSRSDYIREALEEKVGQTAVNGRAHWARNATVAPGPRQADDTVEPVVDRDKCPHPEGNRVALPTGIKMCNLCGARLRS